MKFLGYVFVVLMIFGLGFAACHFGWFQLIGAWVTSLIG